MEYPQAESKIDSMPTVEETPRAYQIIEECHEKINEIERKTGMLLVANSAASNEKEGGPASPLEYRLKELLGHLKELSDRYLI